MDRCNFVVLYLRENELLFEPQRVIASPVERLRRNTPEVSNPWQRQCDETIEKLPHPATTQRNLCADRHPLAQFKCGNGFLRLGNQWLLTCNHAQFRSGALQQLYVLNRLPHTDVQDNPLKLRDLHDVFVAELLHQYGYNLLQIRLTQPRIKLGFFAALVFWLCGGHPFLLLGWSPLRCLTGFT